MHLYLKLFLVKRSTCFRRSFSPSAGAQNWVYSNGICQTAADTSCVHHQELKTEYTAMIYVKQLLLPAASNIRSSKLSIQQRYMSNNCWYQLRPSSGAQNWVYSNGICQTAADTSCVHHQELKTEYTATIYVKQLLLPAASNIRSSKLRIQQRHMSKSCWYVLLLAAGSSSSCLTYIVAVYAVLSSWWWTKRPSETRRAFYKNK
jgi:hypothetical protein